MNQKTLNLSIGVIAFISAILNYAGLASMVDDSWMQKGLCALTSVAVFTALYLFWTWAFGVMPELRHPQKRFASWLTVACGVIGIIALSAYWNVVALAKNEIDTLSKQSVIPRVERFYATAIRQSGVYISVKPELVGFASDIGAKANGEATNGSITGSAGKGGVTAVLRQLQASVANIVLSVDEALDVNSNLKNKGDKCLEQLHQNIQENKSYGASVNCINNVVSDLSNQNIASSVEHAMDGLTSSIIMPVSIKTDKQRQAVQNILDGLQNRADNFASKVRSINNNIIDPLIVERPNIMAGILIYWKSIIPAIATAIAIDLVPLIILIFKVLLYRDAETRDDPRHLWTISELSDAMAQFKQISDQSTAQIAPSTEPKKLSDFDFEDHDKKADGL
ncbi:MAG: hypothetical protein HRU28_13930 [Rhizobiales bacterium]|nr:hypothetical protein [Hyphomicrobiales bacterium]